MARYSGSGWHKQSIRHSNARKYGKAGGTYKTYLPALLDEKGRLLRQGGWYHYKKGSSKPFKYEKPQRMSRKMYLAGKSTKKHFGEPEKGETAGQVLERLSTANTSSETDSRIMQAVLRQTGLYPNAVVVMGVVYLEGKGTMKNPPTSIHSVAKQILQAVEQAKKGKHYGKTKLSRMPSSDEIANHFYDEDWQWFGKKFGKKPKNHMESEQIIEDAKKQRGY